MNEVELKVLRHEAAVALERLQALPWFVEARAALPAVPAPAETWQWRSVLLVAEGHDPGTVEWAWRRLRGRDAKAALLEIERHGEIELRLRQERDRLLARTPASEPPPDDRERGGIAGYREAVSSFASRYVFGCQWSARAVHDALRLDREIRLPSSRGPGWVTLPVAEPIRLDPGEPWQRDELRLLAEQLMRAAEDPGKPEQLRHDRSRTWKTALRATGKRLAGTATSSTERAALAAARRYLDAAVNGELDVDPLSPSDSVDWLADRQRTRATPPKSES